MPVSYWFVGVTAFGYLQRERQQAWNPDFTYCFGYNDWHPNTASLTYCNYGGNRYQGLRTDFQTGGWTAAYKFDLPRWLADPMLIDRSRSIGCNVGYAFSLAFENSYTSRREGYKVMFAACDTFRAAAIEQPGLGEQESTRAYRRRERGLGRGGCHPGDDLRRIQLGRDNTASDQQDLNRRMIDEAVVRLDNQAGPGFDGTRLTRHREDAKGHGK